VDEGALGPCDANYKVYVTRIGITRHCARDDGPFINVPASMAHDQLWYCELTLNPRRVLIRRPRLGGL